MKSILFIDNDTALARSVRSLVEILGIPFEHVARKNEVRRLVATGTVGMIIANSEITTIRYEDMAVEIDTIQKRNRIEKFPIYYVCDDKPVAGENLPPDVPGAFLISRSVSLEQIYRIIDHTLLSDQRIEQSGGFIQYSQVHKNFIDGYQAVLGELRRISDKTLEL